MEQTNKYRTGFSLTELAIVLGVIGIILAAIWAAAGQVYENNRTKIAATETITIATNWQSVYTNKVLDIAAGDITQLTVNNNFAPSEMLPCSSATPCTLNGPWTNSTVSIKAAPTVSSTVMNNAIGIMYSGLSQTDCEHYVNSISGTAGLAALTFNGTTNLVFPPLGTSTLTTSAVDTDCAFGASGYVMAVFSLN